MMGRRSYRAGEDWIEPPTGEPKPRAHPVTVKLDADTLAALRAEADASGLSVSAAVRLAIRHGLPIVEGRRIARRAGIAPEDRET